MLPNELTNQFLRRDWIKRRTWLKIYVKNETFLLLWPEISSENGFFVSFYYVNRRKIPKMSDYSKNMPAIMMFRYALKS